MPSPAETHRPPRVLRLLLVTSEETIPNWLAHCLGELERSGIAAVPFVMRRPRLRPRARDFLYRLHARLDRFLFRRRPDALAPVPVRAALPDARSVGVAAPPGDVDVVLDPLGLLAAGDATIRPRYGVWMPRFGQRGDGKTQSAPGFWEVVEGRETETRLCVRLDGSDRTVAIYESVASADHRSMSRSQNHPYWKLAEALGRNLRLLGGDPDAFVRRLEAAPPFDPLPRRPSQPGTLAVVDAWSALAGRYIADKWRHARYRDQWTLAVRRSNGPLHTLIPPPDRDWADPFPVRQGTEYYVFHEQWPGGAAKGSLVVTVLDDGGRLVTSAIPVLEQDYHLSYPCVFQWDGDFFMIPETAERHRIELYRCVRFPHRWRRERVLLSGVRAFDATPAFLFGRWWLFANVAAYGAGSMDELHLFHAESPLGPWRPHPRNPIKSDVRSARPAGCVFERDGQIYRPAQDCSKHYGYAVSINRIVRLDPEAYEEIEVDKILPDWGPHVTGVHTVNAAGELTLIDCLLRRPRSRRRS